MVNIAKDILDDKRVDMILVTDPYNLRYYTGFRGGEGVAAISRNASYLMTDSRYTEAAIKESKDNGFEVIEYNANRGLCSILKEIVTNNKINKVGFEDLSISYSDYKKYENMFSNCLKDCDIDSLIPLGDSLLIPRQIKSDEEIELLKQAEHIGDLAFDHVLGIIKPGMTELEVAAEIEYSMKKNGAEGLSFDTIAASGVNSSMPHAIPSDKKIEYGDFLTMDFGCRYKGYCSDMTRTICVGKADDDQKKIYNIVLSAQLKVLDELRPGMKCCQVDKIARDYIRNQGFGEYFGHGLGHGVGLYIHESPAFNTRDESIVKANMIETDEPGIYIPGKYGVRIEDMILITQEGCVPLANSPKELIEL
ncbi:MAG: aminopeptidase P family protein [Eubacterium sp.]|nr:aminopeptidase P family protein [Eubacterium sp.]